MLRDPRGLWVKICGVTTPEDARVAVDAGASAVGVVFAPSPRKVTVDQAKAIRDVVSSPVLLFGVFDDSSPWEVGEISEMVGLDGAQFPATLVAERFLPEGMRVMRTVRVRDADDLVEVGRLSCDALHFDAFVAGQLGGTGVQAPWDVIEANRPTKDFILAGGLRPENVAEAVRRLRPAGVDTSSGVEAEPGVKDADKVRRFVEEARR